MKHRYLFPALFLFIAALPFSASGEIADADFQRLHKELRPADDEVWRTIPWKTSVLDAQKEAGEQQKPIFIWAMDGHPLGCT